MFLKIVFLGCVLWLVWRMAKGIARVKAGPARPARRDEQAQNMVRCSHCGVYLPESRALMMASHQKYYCPEHAPQNN